MFDVLQSMDLYIFFVFLDVCCKDEAGMIIMCDLDYLVSILVDNSEDSAYFFRATVVRVFGHSTQTGHISQAFQPINFQFHIDF